jgi:hypothetical protein
MVLGCPESLWIVKLGPVERTNQAATREQAEEGARLLVLDVANQVHRKAAELVPGLREGARCGGGCGEPQVEEVRPQAEVRSYPLEDRSWFTIATCTGFGYKLACRRAQVAGDVEPEPS